VPEPGGVLIVDDEELSRLAVRKLLGRLFPELPVAGEAENGRLAVEMSESLRPELVLMDIKIPGLNGIDAAERIRAALPSAKIIILSAYDSFGFAQRAINMGLSGYLLKPVSEAEFVKVVGQALAEIKAARGSRASAPAPRPDEGCPKAGAQALDARSRIELAIASLPLCELSLERVAEALSMSPQYLSRLFKELFGVKFVERATTLRLDAAMVILETEEVTVEELCRRLGWSDAAHFSRLFREREGLTPKAFARRFRQDRAAGRGES
jgi:two-component system, response regulator YesN